MVLVQHINVLQSGHEDIEFFPELQAVVEHPIVVSDVPLLQKSFLCSQAEYLALLGSLVF